MFFPAVLTYLDQSYIEFLDKEVFPEIPLADTLETDIVVKTKFQGKDAFFLVHIESQAQQKSGFEKRMYRFLPTEAKNGKANRISVFYLAKMTYQFTPSLYFLSTLPALPNQAAIESYFLIKW